MTPRQIFRRRFGKQGNFMTPDVMQYGKAGALVWELSEGRGFRRSNGDEPPIYGVTVLTADGADALDAKGERLSCCLHSLADAHAFIRQLEQPPAAD